jgi:hypothetical protein
MTTDAWALLKTDPGFKNLVSTIRANLRRPRSKPARPSSRALDRARSAHGRLYALHLLRLLHGSRRTAQVKKILPANTVLVGSSGIDGVRHFGAIRDLDAGIQARQYFVKSWVEPDPSRRFLLMQSAPLLVPYRPNAVLSATVA